MSVSTSTVTSTSASVSDRTAFVSAMHGRSSFLFTGNHSPGTKQQQMLSVPGMRHQTAAGCKLVISMKALLGDGLKMLSVPGMRHQTAAGCKLVISMKALLGDGLKPLQQV